MKVFILLIFLVVVVFVFFFARIINKCKINVKHAV